MRPARIKTPKRVGLGHNPFRFARMQRKEATLHSTRKNADPELHFLHQPFHGLVKFIACLIRSVGNLLADLYNLLGPIFR